MTRADARRADRPHAAARPARSAGLSPNQSSRQEPSTPFIDTSNHPLLVVTAVAPDGERGGCLAGFATQCSIKPPRFLVCISRVNHTFDIIQRVRFLGLHLLGEDQVKMASLFGEQTGDTVDKLSEVSWHPGPEGLPLLDDCAVWMVVEILRRVDVGDHEAQVTSPVDGGTGNRRGLLTNKSVPPLAPGHPIT